jgi:hypothetical protein
VGTEVIVGALGFGTAVIGLVTAYVARNRHVTHRHELVAEKVPSQQPERASLVELTKCEEDIEECTALPGETNSEPTINNKYARAALRAVEIYYAAPTTVTPQEAWETATTELFGAGTPAQKKGCPKGAFLGLCQAGYVSGIPKGDYTRSEMNREYAVDATELLAVEPQLADNWPELWKRVLNGVSKQHNSQMQVVIALWQKGLLRSQLPQAKHSESSVRL